MRLNFHGLLRDLYGDSVEMESATIADALEGFSRQQTNWPSDVRIAVVGHRTEESLQEYADEIDLMPAMMGGGGKFGSILLGAIMIGVAFIPGVGTALSASLLLSGGLMIAQGVIGLFMKSPKIGKNEDPEASKYLPVNKNTTEIGTPITLAWGRTPLAGHWLSLQSDSSNLSFGNFPNNPT